MALQSSRTLDAAAAADHIGRWMTDYIDRSGLDGWVVGVSGGIDSAVTSTLAARTGRPTTVLRMPIHLLHHKLFSCTILLLKMLLHRVLLHKRAHLLPHKL